MKSKGTSLSLTGEGLTYLFVGYKVTQRVSGGTFQVSSF